MRQAPEKTARAAAPAGACAVLLGWAAFGGADAGTQALAEVGIAATVALAVAVARVGAARLDRAAGVVVAATAGLAAWSALSIVWSIAGDRSWDQANALLASLVFLGLGTVLAAAWGARGARAGAVVLTVVCAAIVGWALLGAVVPSLFPDGDRSARLREPFGHAPPLALVAGVSLPLAARLLGSAIRPRAVGALLAFGATVALLLTQSRAGILAAVVVVGLWGLATRDLVLAVARLLPAVASGLVVAGIAFTQPALVDDGSARADRVDAGIVLGVALALGAAAAVGLELRLPLERLVRERRRHARAAVVAVALAGAVAAGVGLAVGGFSEGECANDAGRLVGACANNRLDWWGEAWEVFRANPGLGTGARTFAVARTPVREAATTVSQPHSLPLQLLADLGLVGLALGLAALAAGALALRAALGRLAGEERRAAAALVTLPVAFLVHGLFDYDADFLGVTAPVLLAVGAVLAAGRPVVRVPAVVLPAVAAVAGAAVVSLLLPYLSARSVDEAYEASFAGRDAEAARLARRAASLDPLSLRAVYARAEVATDDRVALAALVDATELQPRNADTWYQLGLYRYEFQSPRDSCGAYFALNASYTLDPVSTRWAPGGVLDRARDDVNAGACEPPGSR